MRRALALTAALAACGCERGTAEVRHVTASKPHVVAPTVLASVAVVTEASPAAPPPPGDWVQALRAGRYDDAARALDADPALEKRPELKLARAKAAVELGDAEQAVSLLAGLEQDLPVLADRVRALRAEAQLAAGPYVDAATYYAHQSDVDSLAQAALARERAGDLAQARGLASRVVAALKGKRHHATEVLARSVRARCAAKLGVKAQAASDLRWLALEDPVGSPDADVHLTAVAPERALTKEERLGRALALGRAGKLDRANLELERLAKAAGAPIAPARLERARAFALYYARHDYEKASELFTRAARGPGVDAVECRFYAARSLARADDDERAVHAYRELRSRYPKSHYADLASYLVARSHYSAGRFAEAERAYDSYLSGFPHGRSRGDAEYERAVTWLALGKSTLAANAFESLAHHEHDARSSARLHLLEGVARAGTGEKANAVSIFEEVVSSQPLGFTALAAAARLSALDANAPDPMPPSKPASAPPPLGIDLPDAVRMLHELGLDDEAELELLHAEGGLKQHFGGRVGEGLCDAYGLLDVAARRYQIAQAEVDARSLLKAPSLATQWEWDCVYPRPYRATVPDVSQQTDVPEALLYAVMRQESGFRADAVSGAGARGLMQLMPATAERLAQELGEPYDPSALSEPATSLHYAAAYLSKLLKAFDGNVTLAAAAYNAGPVAVRRWLEGAHDLPLDVFVARIPYDETREYVERVVGNYARYRYLEQGSDGVPRLALELPTIQPPTEPEY